MDSVIYKTYIDILHSELIPAMGCTEPIAIALTAATAKSHFKGGRIESVDVAVSGNIIKNVKSVMVPGTGGLRGIPAATAAGIVAGHPERELEVLEGMTDSEKAAIAEFINNVPINITESVSEFILDIGITVNGDSHSTYVRTAQHHTGLYLIVVDGVTVFSRRSNRMPETSTTPHLVSKTL